MWHLVASSSNTMFTKQPVVYANVWFRNVLTGEKPAAIKKR